VELVATPAQLSHLLQALLRTRPPQGRRVAVFADGGGQAQIAADCLESAGLAVPAFGPALAEAVAKELPATAATANPVDVAGGGEQDISCFERVAGRLAETDEVDAVLMTGFFGGYGDYSAELGAGELAAAQGIASRSTARSRTRCGYWTGCPAAPRKGPAAYPPFPRSRRR
jgi:acyl-CoA synthetase (NDP forming)